MTSKFSFIKAVSILLKVVWYAQWLFMGSLVVFAITIIANPSFVDLDKLNGFKVEFKKVELPRSIVSPPNEKRDVFLTNGTGRMHIEDYKSNIVLHRLLGVLLELFIFMMIIHFLTKLFNNMAKGDYFILENGIFIKFISFLIIASGIIPNILYYIINLNIENTLHLDAIIFKSRLSLDLKTILLGLLVFVIAQVFIKGNELREENELTI
ncbi:MAG: DUF2975 domain-containing protein [Flavobacteriales bacterium]|nr:DUF2975 domain-containing protein [Flavobacteriales bacterium]